MSLDAKFLAADRFQDAEVRLTLTGPHDIFRFAINMLRSQVEFCEAGIKVLAQLRDSMGADRFDPMGRSMLGIETFEKYLGHGYFTRSEEEL